MLKKSNKLTDGRHSCLEIIDKETYCYKGSKSRNRSKILATKNTAMTNKMRKKVLNTISNRNDISVRRNCLTLHRTMCAIVASTKVPRNQRGLGTSTPPSGRVVPTPTGWETSTNTSQCFLVCCLTGLEMKILTTYLPSRERKSRSLVHG